MSIIGLILGTLFGLVMLILIAKAICETIYGLALWAVGLLILWFAYVLEAFVLVMRTGRKLHHMAFSR